MSTGAKKHISGDTSHQTIALRRSSFGRCASVPLPSMCRAASARAERSGTREAARVILRTGRGSDVLHHLWRHCQDRGSSAG
ncbi:hypothetical protein FKP32DRAFT_1117656 [Trametes sanguinea]|nr:hypothetical protein FKP32DRAFT_1117656 [Trametes sanguinea]